MGGANNSYNRWLITCQPLNKQVQYQWGLNDQPQLIVHYYNQSEMTLLCHVTFEYCHHGDILVQPHDHSNYGNTTVIEAMQGIYTYSHEQLMFSNVDHMILIGYFSNNPTPSWFTEIT